jgi:wobble nucleotide-excising tRNase
VAIVKIEHIGAVGRFRSYSAHGDVTFKKYTLIFGENGRGKTTLCSILRSMQLNEPAHIIGRTTLGQDKPPVVIMKLASGDARFANGAWSDHGQRIHIFDAQYVADNVYFGDSIGTQQRRNLCKLMLGEEGIAYRKAYDAADDAIDAKNGALKGLRQTLTAHVRSDQLDEFLALPSDTDIDARIDAKLREVQGFREIDRLRSRPGAELIEMPPLPMHLSNILNQTLESVSRNADRRVREHLATHGMHGNQDWIARGMPHMRDDCPFCGQPIEGLELIEAYQGYFNHAYLEFRQELDRYSGLPGRHYSDAGVNLLVQKVTANRAQLELWRQNAALAMPDDSSLSSLSDVIFNFRKEMLAVLTKKSADPLVAAPLPERYLEAYSAMEELTEAVKAYNHAVDAANGVIEKFKTSATPHRLQSAQNELRWLELTKIRHEEPVKSAAEDFKRFTAEKEILDKEKEQARDKLDKYSEEVVTRHLKVINDHLDNFNNGFSIAKLKVGYTGREPNSTFCAVVNGETVDMGNSDTPLDQPSFKNTLSGGDRTTLALAFFFAQIADAPYKDQCIVVLDDPFNSQDRARRTYTINQIIRCGNEVGQVVVLSHDNLFLREMWDKPLPTVHRKALIMAPCGTEDTVLLEWKIEEDMEGEDAANKRVLASFHQGAGGEPRDVVKRIRPVVETS